MVVPVLQCRPLGGHSGVSHDDGSIIGDAELHPVGREGMFLNDELLPGVAGIARGIGAPGFAGDGEDGNDSALFRTRQPSLGIDQPEQTAHYTSPSLSTGSLT